MSRIGRAPIPVPAGVQVDIEGNVVTVKGPKGQLTRTFHTNVTIALQDGHLEVSRANETRPVKALHGLSRALLANMVQGVSQGYQKVLEISGVGYRASKMGDRLVLALGYSHPVELVPPPGIAFVVETPTRVGVQGVDKEVVGQVAAEVRAVRKPEPYRGKGIHYLGERIRRKAGKGGKAGGKKK